MTADNLLFHNVESMIDAPGGGKYMLRVPKDVAGHINEKAQNANLSNCGVEIRFVMPESGAVKIKLRFDPSAATHSIATEDNNKEDKEPIKTCVQGLVYYGSFGTGIINIPTEEKEFTFELPEEEDMRRRFYALCKLSKEYGHPFDPRCVRIILREARTVVYCGAEGNICAPSADMMPSRKLLAYGSSLTHGSLGINGVNTFANITAERLGFDLYNLGLAGSCHAEPKLIDYISEAEWDVALIELGANMMNKFTEEEFEERVKYAVNTIACKNPEKKVFFLSSFYQYRDIIGDEKIKNFREIIKNAVKGNAVYLNGKEIMPREEFLSSDLVHLGVQGARLAGKNIAEAIKREVSL